jgi:hypothetical protein
VRPGLRAVTALALLSGLASCSAAPEPEPVGGLGDLHIALDGSMTFCAFDVDPGFSGVDEPCSSGIETTGFELDVVEDGSTFVWPDGRRQEGPVLQPTRRAPDSTQVLPVLLVGTIEDDVFDATEYRPERAASPEERRQAAPEPGGFLAPVAPD